jgi:hypothetical protein
MPSTTNIRQANATATPANNPRSEMQQLLDAGAADSTYEREWSKYKKWVEDNYDDEDIGLEFEMDPPPGEEYGGRCYLTRANLDAYFQNVVVHRKGNKETIKRIEQSLKFFALYKENDLIDADVAANFTSRTMLAAMAAQQVKHRAEGSISSQLDDKCPHRFCKHTLSISERLRVMKAAMDCNEWQNAAVAVNLGHNVAIRGASTRKLTLCDLRLANGYGPGSNKASGDPRFDRTLMLILRKGPVHKDRFKTTKQVGMWRHRNWLLDPNFSVALAVIRNLREGGDNIEFRVREGRRNGGTARPHWWDRKLISWDTLKGTV